MMRLDESREAGLVNPSSAQYSSLETQMSESDVQMSKFDVQNSEFDVPMSSMGRPKSRSRSYAVGACIAFLVVVAVVSGFVAGAKSSGRADDPGNAETRKQHAHFAPAPSPYEGGSLPAPPLGGFTEPITSPIPPSAGAPPPPPLPAFAPEPYSNGYRQIRYETICQQTKDPAICLDIFARNANSNKVDLQQWTLMTMEAADRALNESYTLAVSLRDANPDSPALWQCIDVFGMAIEEVEGSMYIVADIDAHNPGPAATDVAVSLTSAATDHDTCPQGIDDAGSFQGAEKITGARAARVNTLLSIALTFVNNLALGDGNRRRRLLSLQRLFPGKRLL